jgi:hypothetical protein
VRPAGDVADEMSEMIRLRGYFGQTEVNTRGILYAVNKWGCVSIPAEDVASLLHVGGFHIADENDPSASNSTLSDVAEVVWHLPAGRVRSTLLSLCENTNQMNYFADSARPNTKII